MRRCNELRRLVWGWTLLVQAGLTSSLCGQIVRDGTLGSLKDTTLAGPHHTIPANLGRTVCKSDNTACNLFHSFDQFNLHTNESATFTGPANVANVLARVTGGLVSQINGLLATSGMPGANFFLLNPSGVVFGPGAQLDVNGSFTVTTANELQLADGGRFTATTHTTDSVLTTASPTAFGFLTDHPAEVVLDHGVLKVHEQATLSVVGGDLQVTGAQLTAQQGGVVLASVGSSGNAHIGADAPRAIDMSEFVQLGQVTIEDQATVSTEQTGHGVTVQAASLVMQNRGEIRTFAPDAETASNINVTVQDLQIVAGALMSASTPDSGQSGSVAINAGQILIDGQDAETFTGISVATEADVDGGPGGHIQITAKDLHLVNSARVSADTFGSGPAGTIEVTAESLEIVNSGLVSADTFASGNGGQVQVAAEQIIIDGQNSSFTGISTDTIADLDAGPGGQITIIANQLQLVDGGLVSAGAFGSGSGGEIDFTSDQITMDGQAAAVFTGIFVATVAELDGGPGGQIHIATTDLRVLNEATISAGTSGSGSGGAIDVTAQTVVIDGQGSDLFTGIGANSTLDAIDGHGGDSGNIQITTNLLHVMHGGVVTTDTFATGRGGRIDITADEEVLIDGQGAGFTGITAQTLAPLDGGPGGQIHVTTTDVHLFNDARVSAGTSGSAAAGAIVVTADSLHATSGALLTAATFGSGSGGAIDITADQITIDGQGLTAFTGISVSTAAELDGGPGGHVDITTTSLHLINEATISAGTRGSGSGGVARIAAQQIVIDGQGSEAFTGIGTTTTLDVTDGSGGDSGDILITTGVLQVIDGGVIATGTFGSGRGGQIDITADQMVIDGKGTDAFTGISVETQSGLGGGQGGNIQIKADRLRIVHGGLIATDTFGSGRGGDINILADEILIDGKGIQAFTGISVDSLTNLGGDSGDIRLTAGSLTLVNGGDISAVHRGSGTAGNITVTTATAIDLFDSTISAESVGDGGNILLNTVERVQLVNSNVTTDAGQTGGNITIDPVLVDLQQGSKITADAIEEAGGNITIIANILRQCPDCQITASSEKGVSGTINISSSLDISGSLVTLPAMLLDTQAQLQPHCAVQFGSNASSFTVSDHRVDEPLTPGRWLPSVHLGDAAARRPAGSEPEL